jgi:hypothetical protein
MRITTRVLYLSIYAWGQRHIRSINFLARGAGVALQQLQTLERDAVEEYGCPVGGRYNGVRMNWLDYGF